MKSSPKEIKIYAQNINTGGALILLETLIQHILHMNLKVIVRVYIGSEKCLRMSHSRLVCVELPSLFDKMKVMFKRDKHAIYFGNLPPARQAQHSLLYIHNYYIAAPQEELLADPTISWRTKIKYVACRKYINLFAQNTSAIACQTSLMRSYMGQCLLPGQEIDVFPFYRSVKGQDKKKDTDFCYVGLPSAHKNHERLLQAFALLSEVKCQTSCIMTIPESPQNQHLLRQIAKINREGYVTIENRGYVSFEEASEIYHRCRALVFPSVKESYGLPLIEAAQAGCSVLAADLPYAHALLTKAHWFDPMQPTSIAESMRHWLQHGKTATPPKIRTKNTLHQLLRHVLEK